MEEEMEETLQPAENQRLVNVRRYGLLMFLAASLILTLVALIALAVQ